MPSSQPSVSISSFHPRQFQPSGEGRAEERIAAVIPLPVRQSEGVSAPAERFARELRDTVIKLLGAEALRRHQDWLSGFLTEPRREAASFDDDLRRFVRALDEELDDHVLEDGVVHPAEDTPSQMVRRHPARTRAWLSEAIAGKAGVDRVSVMRLVGRLPRQQAVPWGYDVAASALSDAELDFRDAAVKALELWRGRPALDILAEHRESEPWLADYLARLIEELKHEG